MFQMRKEPAISSVPQQVETLQRNLEEEARHLARETGFIERERAFNGADFAQAMILGWFQHPDERLEGFTQILERRDVSITASGLSQRFTKEAVTFMQRVLERLTEVQMQVEAVDVPLLRRFSAVRVEDSSVVPLPQDLADISRGCGGSAGMSEAASNCLCALMWWLGNWKDLGSPMGDTVTTRVPSMTRTCQPEDSLWRTWASLPYGGSLA